MDILSDISKLPLRSKVTLGFVLNVIVNGYFNFLLIGPNSRIKVLRNIRKHKNIILDKTTWNAYRTPIMPFLFEHYTHQQIKILCQDIEAQRQCLMFDKTDKEKVNFILQEEPRKFLQKLITLCHIQLFMLGLNDKLILSETLFNSYWCTKYDLASCTLKSMPVFDLLEHLKDKQRELQSAEFDIL